MKSAILAGVDTSSFVAVMLPSSGTPPPPPPSEPATKRCQLPLKTVVDALFTRANALSPVFTAYP